MSGNAQFDLHPDAERLNAFAEQALAGEERERMAAHLAVCSRCREVVFLAQESNEEEPVLVAAAVPARLVVARSSWFGSRGLLWVPVGALAAGITVAYLVHVRRGEPAIQTAQVANEAGPVRAPEQAPAVVAKHSEKSGSAAAEKKAAPALTQQRQVVATAEPAAPPPNVNEPIAAKENALHASAGVAADLKTVPEGSVADRQRTAVVAGEVQGTVAKRAAQASAETAERTQDQVVAAAAPMMQAEVTPTPSPKMAPNMRSVGTSRALYVAKPMSGLPSGLAAVSTAFAEHNVLAVDKAGSVFLSADAGAHWESIGRQWGGRAVAVRTQAEVKAEASAGGGMPQALFELVNDQGQVWVSADGRSWKAR